MKFFSLKVLIGIIFLLNSFNFVVYAAEATPSYTFTNEQRHEEIKAPANSELDLSYVVQNLDPERDVLLRIMAEPVADTEEYKGFPVEWVQDFPFSIRLEPNEKRRLEYKLSVPEDAEIGLYRVTIVAQLVDYERKAGGGAVSFSSAIGYDLNIEVTPEQFFSKELVEKINVTLNFLIIWNIGLTLLIIILVWGMLVKKKKK